MSSPAVEIEPPTISLSDWEFAVQSASPVGRCTIVGCSGLMLPMPAIEASGQLWFDARCNVCDHETSSPGGHVQTRRKPSYGATPPRGLKLALRQTRAAQRERDFRERAAGD